MSSATRRNIVIPDELWAELKTYAEAARQTRSELVRQVLWAWADEHRSGANRRKST